MHRDPVNNCLNDDELLLMDALWCGWVPAERLKRQEYADLMHSSYTHALSDAEMYNALAHMLRSGLVDQVTDDGVSLFMLTRRGTAIWETRRLPDWDSFVGEALESSDPETDELFTKLTAPSSSALARALTAFSQLFDNLNCVMSVEHQVQEHGFLLDSWRFFPKIHIASFAFPANAELVEVPAAERTWWSSVPELLRLRRAE